MPKKARTSTLPRNIALCYVRQSYTRNATDMDSPERQKANIEALCMSREWIPEFFTDAEGHKSAFYEENRPGWLSLKERIADPDVIAIVANDPNRIHRRFLRTGQLLELVVRHDFHFMCLAPPSALLCIKKLPDK